VPTQTRPAADAVWRFYLFPYVTKRVPSALVSMMAGCHGSITLAYAQNDPAFVEGEVKRLKQWLREIRVLLERAS